MLFLLENYHQITLDDSYVSNEGLKRKVNIIMIMRKLFLQVLHLLIFHPSLILADIEDQIIAFNCYSCHGNQLSTLYPRQIPSKPQLSNTLLAFKYDNKKATIMNRITKGYSDEELESVASYLSKKN